MKSKIIFIFKWYPNGGFSSDKCYIEFHSKLFSFFTLSFFFSYIFFSFFIYKLRWLKRGWNIPRTEGTLIREWRNDPLINMWKGFDIINFIFNFWLARKVLVSADTFLNWASLSNQSAALYDFDKNDSVTYSSDTLFL